MAEVTTGQTDNTPNGSPPRDGYGVCWSHQSKCNPVLWAHHLLLGSVSEEAKSPSLKALSRALFFSQQFSQEEKTMYTESFTYAFTHDNIWNKIKIILGENTWSHAAI